MVTTTTKTLNYSITKGNATNSVNATITSTPGFNSNYLGKVPGILKIVELILAAVALGLVASLRQDYQPMIRDPVQPGAAARTEADDWRAVDGSNSRVYIGPLSYLREQYLAGEVYFLCAHTAAIVMLVTILGAYLFHTTSAMIIPKATTLENVANLLLALLLLAAGILEIVQTVNWMYQYNANNNPAASNRVVMEHPAYRYAAGAIALLNGLLFIGSFVMSRKELAGPKTL